MNDGGEFRRYFLDIYPKEPELKFEHQSNHASFLNLGCFRKGDLIYKLFDKMSYILYKKQYPSKYFLFHNQR